MMLGATVALLCLTPLALLLLPVGRRHPAGHGRSVVAIVVLGDLARSPRMLYHAQSCIGYGLPVWLIGYLDTPLPETLTSSALLRIIRLRPPPDSLARLPRALYLPVAAVKLVWMLVALLVALFSLASPTYLLVQARDLSHRTMRLMTMWHRTRLHYLRSPSHALSLSSAGRASLSTGTTLAPLSSRCASARNTPWYGWPDGASVRPCYARDAEDGRLEATFGRRAYAHLFVTDAMRQRLSAKWHLVCAHCLVML
jgi:beta-1,4-mannosyltransferase